MNTKKLRVLLHALTDGPISLRAFKWQLGVTQNEINFMMAQKWISVGQTKTNVWIEIIDGGFQRLRQLDKEQLDALVLQEIVK
jgi:hypothetical protein